MEDRLTQIMRRGHDARCAIVLVVPSGLDEIRARFGQAIGDRAFRTFASRLRAVVRQSDICGRHRGEGFIYLIDVDVRYKTVSATCARLAAELSPRMNFEGLALDVAAAIGAAIYPFDGSTAAAVLAGAEQSLERCRADALPYFVASTSEQADADHPVNLDDQVAAGAGEGSPSQRADRRSVRRQRVLKRGQIFFPDVPSAIECTVRDISSRGARLRVSAPLMAPSQFAVALGHSSERTPVELVWQTGNELGVRFVHPQPQFEQ
jgi:diguanylate cyclase (GGDEF)-like protein